MTPGSGSWTSRGCPQRSWPFILLNRHDLSTLKLHSSHFQHGLLGCDFSNHPKISDQVFASQTTWKFSEFTYFGLSKSLFQSLPSPGQWHWGCPRRPTLWLWKYFGVLPTKSFDLFTFRKFLIGKLTKIITKPKRIKNSWNEMMIFSRIFRGWNSSKIDP